jgi:hypothetical protein
MANFSLEQLLQYPPLEALMISYNEVFGTQLNPRYVELVHVIPGEAGQCTVKLKARDVLPNKDEQRFFNTGEFALQRLNLGEVFAEEFSIEHVGEIVSHDVGRIITQKTGVVFDASDFVSEVLTPENNVLKAAPESLRWYGSLTITRS